METHKPQLVIIPTPIGNLADLTPRAQQLLTTLEVLACEDTRRTKQLLQHFGITGKKRFLAHHQGNEEASAQGLVKLMQAGQSVGYVTDSGMPGISDPGYVLVREVLAAGFTVSPLAGPSAVTTALAGAGIAASRFTFLGFLPRGKGPQTKLLQRFVDVPEALVIYESPQRLAKTLAILAEVLGERPACLCRELTKAHETFVRDDLPALAAWAAAQEGIKGECTLVIGSAAASKLS